MRDDVTASAHDGLPRLARRALERIDPSPRARGALRHPARGARAPVLAGLAVAGHRLPSRERLPPLCWLEPTPHRQRVELTPHNTRVEAAYEMAAATAWARRRGAGVLGGGGDRERGVTRRWCARCSTRSPGSTRGAWWDGPALHCAVAEAALVPPSKRLSPPPPRPSSRGVAPPRTHPALQSGHECESPRDVKLHAGARRARRATGVVGPCGPGRWVFLYRSTLALGVPSYAGGRPACVRHRTASPPTVTYRGLVNLRSPRPGVATASSAGRRPHRRPPATRQLFGLRLPSPDGAVMNARSGQRNVIATLRSTRERWAGG